MELLEYWRLLRKWLWLIVLTTVVAAVAAFFFSRSQTPIYQASTRLLVNQGSGSNPTVTYTDLLMTERLTRTYAEILTAKPVLTAAFDALGIDVEQALDTADITVQPVRDTQLIDLKVEHPSSILAAAIANSLPQVFIAYNTDQQSARFQESKQALQVELTRLGGEVDGVEQEITRAGTDAENEALRTLLQNRLAQYRSSYSSILSQLESIRLAEANTVDTVSVVEPADEPEFPVRPRVMMNTLLAAIVGAMLGLGAAFLIEYLDDTVKTPDDISRLSGLSTLGVIARDRKTNNGERSIVTLENPRSPNAEAFRAIRTGIQFASVDEPIRSLLVTSAGPSEGKSTTIANLAVVLAQTGKRVVLIDADLRKPSQHKFWGVPNTVGLTGALLQPELPASLDYLLTPTQVENLWLITSGQLPHNPSELLGSQKLQALTQRLLADHDVVLFDAPPALAVTDPIVLSQSVDGVLVVVDAGVTRQPALIQTLTDLDKVSAHVIGIALNKFKSGRSSGYYYYSYQRYYEDDGDEGSSTGGKKAKEAEASSKSRTSKQQSQNLGQRISQAVRRS